jgi:hypothetical protein
MNNVGAEIQTVQHIQKQKTVGREKKVKVGKKN